MNTDLGGTDQNRNLRNGGSTNASADANSATSAPSKEGSLQQQDNFGSCAKAQPRDVVGKFNPKPIELNLSGTDNIFRHLLDV